MARFIKLNREQLSQFLPNFEAIRAFENLFQNVDDALIIADESDIAVSIADSKAVSALAQIQALVNNSEINAAIANNKADAANSALLRIAQALELLATAPVNIQNNATYDDLRPVQVMPKIDDPIDSALMMMGG